jgi:crossover junction endodeoxyribonuclease RuvC
MTDVVELPIRESALASVRPAYALGIDIGVRGHIAGLDRSGAVLWLHAMPTTLESNGRHAINAPLFSGVAAASHARVAYVELVTSRPTDSRVGSFSFGRSRGVCEGALGALSIPIVWIAPQTWKRLAGIPPGKEHKDLCRTRAIAKWPALAESFRRKSDADAAEACLIGLCGLTRHPSP